MISQLGRLTCIYWLQIRIFYLAAKTRKERSKKQKNGAVNASIKKSYISCKLLNQSCKEEKLRKSEAIDRVLDFVRQRFFGLLKAKGATEETSSDQELESMTAVVEGILLNKKDAFSNALFLVHLCFGWQVFGKDFLCFLFLFFACFWV